MFPKSTHQPSYQDIFSSPDLFINIAVAFSPFFVIIDIVFMGHEAAKCSGIFFYFQECNICIRHCSVFHLFTGSYTHNSAVLTWLKPINVNLQ